MPARGGVEAGAEARLIETFLMEHLGIRGRTSTRRPRGSSTPFRTSLRSVWRSCGASGAGSARRPIPAADGTLVLESSKPLSETQVGRRVRRGKVDNESTSVRNHLGERGLVPGRTVSVKEVRSVDGVVTVEDELGKEHPLGESLACAIFVEDAPREDQ